MVFNEVLCEIAARIGEGTCDGDLGHDSGSGSDRDAKLVRPENVF